MKKQILKDALNIKDLLESSKNKYSIPAYKGILYERFHDDFGKDILHKIDDNTVTVGGAIISLEHLCGVTASWKPKTLNELYNINPSIPNATGEGEKIALFGVGTGGCDLQFGSVAEKDVKRRDIPNLIPLRVGDRLTGDDSDRYFFKKDNGDGTYCHYLKEFPVPIEIKTCWKDAADDEIDGTEVLEEIAESTRSERLQTFADFILDFNTSDVREYFEYLGALPSARYNSIGLFTGEKVTLEDGTQEYANIRLFSYLNIENKSVKIKTASEYLYRVLSLV